MSLIKDIYSPAFYKSFAATAAAEIPGFDKKQFTREIFNDDFAVMEWKQRMQHTTRVFHNFMPANFGKAARIVEKITRRLQEQQPTDTLAYVFLADYIAAYGLDDFGNAVKAMEVVTQFITCEFAVRPFLLKHNEAMLQQMLAWSKHNSYKVRRFASEGSRPRLPWGMAIPALKKDPAPILPILENLKNDPSDWVRKSVANNINDIAKDNPAIVLQLAAAWQGISKETDAIIKHGSRTLLKQGHTEILKHYGLDCKNISINGLTIKTPEVAIGDSVAFSFTVANNSKKPRTIRLEYGVYYRKAKGHLARKVFKISEKIYQPGEQAEVHRKQSFKLITTRTFYPGEHQLSVIVNGEEKGMGSFIITA